MFHSLMEVLKCLKIDYETLYYDFIGFKITSNN